MFIYKTKNLINGKEYIGLCTRDDDNYFGSGVLIKQAIRKYGKENFERIILAETNDFEELLDMEEHYIKIHNAVESDKYYNMAEGGKAGNSELLKEYWGSMTKEERKFARNWNGHFMNNTFDGYNESWVENVSKGVKKSWDEYTEEERSARGKIISKRRKELGTAVGKRNPMWGRSVVKEKNLKWYTNGVDNLYVTEGTQPKDYRRGRTMKSRKKNEQL